MRLRKIKLLIKCTVLFVSLLLSSNISACVCRYLTKTENLEQRIEESKTIFVGRVIKIEFVKNKDSIDIDASVSKYLIKIQFLVSRFYKNKLTSDTLNIYQENSNCQYSFQFNKKYLVYT